MLLDLNKKILNIKGEEFQGEDDFLSKQLANILYFKADEINGTSTAIRYETIARSLHTVGKVEITDEEREKIVDFLEKKLQPGAMLSFVKTQILQNIRDCRIAAQEGSKSE